MPSRIPDLGTTIKVVSVPSGSRVASRGHECHLFNGPPNRCLYDANPPSIDERVVRPTTDHKTGSVLATRLLISKVPKTLVAFGAGKQIKAHVDLHLHSSTALARTARVYASLRRLSASHILPSHSIRSSCMTEIVSRTR
ncbi:hypothetical protein EV363DRAFT_1336444 [Boletus edulis]|nr:hypothetical protein EV363DRAFT_1336444 [Boletus edulis]